LQGLDTKFSFKKKLNKKLANPAKNIGRVKIQNSVKKQKLNK
jgi:hypothetical protein